MKAKFVKVLSLLLCVAVISSLFCLGAYAVTPSTETEKLRFNSDSSFKILHLTDLHLHDEYDDIQKMSDLFIKKMIKDEKPDLIVITGDIATNSTLDKVLENIDRLMTMLNEFKIPVAVNFGNHDSEQGFISREALIREYMKYDCSITVDDGDLLPGAGTYNIPILSSNGKKVAFNIWMIDSGDYDENGDYASTDPAIINWYVNKSNELKAENGGEKVNSLMFQHIIVPEIYDAFKTTSKLNPFAIKHKYADNKYCVLNPENTIAGRLVENPAPGSKNNGQFDAVTSQGDVLAMFFGHDHSNTFRVNYKGVDLVATPKAQFGLTSRNSNDFTDSAKGARIIVINEKDTSKYETHIIDFGSLYSVSDLFKLNDSYERKAAAKCIFFDALYKLIYGTGTKLFEIISCSKVDFG